MDTLLSATFTSKTEIIEYIDNSLYSLEQSLSYLPEDLFSFLPKYFYLGINKYKYIDKDFKIGKGISWIDCFIIKKNIFTFFKPKILFCYTYVPEGFHSWNRQKYESKILTQQLNKNNLILLSIEDLNILLEDIVSFDRFLSNQIGGFYKKSKESFKKEILC